MTRVFTDAGAKGAAGRAIRTAGVPVAHTDLSLSVMLGDERVCGRRRLFARARLGLRVSRAPSPPLTSTLSACERFAPLGALRSRCCEAYSSLTRAAGISPQ